jgi:hypothetical protein
LLSLTFIDGSAGFPELLFLQDHEEKTAARAATIHNAFTDLIAILITSNKNKK